MMTTADFEKVAEAMKLNRPADLSISPALHRQWASDVMALSAAMKQINPRFDGVQFERACGLDRKETAR